MGLKRSGDNGPVDEMAMAMKCDVGAKVDRRGCSPPSGGGELLLRITHGTHAWHRRETSLGRSWELSSSSSPSSPSMNVRDTQLSICMIVDIASRTKKKPADVMHYSTNRESQMGGGHTMNEGFKGARAIMRHRRSALVSPVRLHANGTALYDNEES